jgi:hypothetical protein
VSSSVSVSKEVKDRIEKLRVDMGIVLGKPPQYKTTIEKLLAFAEENKEEFIEWLKKGDKASK